MGPTLPPEVLPLHPPLLQGQYWHPHHHRQGTQDHQIFCQAFHQTTLATLLLNVLPNHHVFPSNPFPKLRNTKRSSHLHTVFSCLHRFWCLFCARTWNTFGFWVDIFVSMLLDLVLFSWLYVVIAVFAFPLVE